ncbi:MAG: hypothetical protein IIW01_05895, partial [Thermoguttaceae bacterium]|nr:hypothetical protein [Thermoguttaceae bacterium]
MGEVKRWKGASRRKRFLTGAALASLIFAASAPDVVAQLPPTSNRIAAVDSAVDANALFESDFV